jgi:flagellar hook assembly protein FlgD
MERPADVSIILFDLLGRRVRTVVDARYGAGTFSTLWDGKNDAGIPVATGVYFMVMRVEAGNPSGSSMINVRKMLLLR